MFCGHLFAVIVRNSPSRLAAGVGCNRSRPRHRTYLLERFKNSARACNHCANLSWTYFGTPKNNACLPGYHSIILAILLYYSVPRIPCRSHEPDSVHTLPRLDLNGSHHYMGFRPKGDRTQVRCGMGVPILLARARLAGLHGGSWMGQDHAERSQWLL